MKDLLQQTQHLKMELIWDLLLKYNMSSPLDG